MGVGLGRYLRVLTYSLKEMDGQRKENNMTFRVFTEPIPWKTKFAFHNVFEFSLTVATMGFRIMLNIVGVRIIFSMP